MSDITWTGEHAAEWAEHYGGQAEQADPITEAVDTLFRNRHHLAPDALRSLQCIYVCASEAAAARSGRPGQPYETGWLDDPVVYATHDVAECGAPPPPDHDLPF